MIQSLVLNSGLCQMSSSPPRPSPSLSSSDLKPCSAEPVYSRDPRIHQAPHPSDISQFLSPGFSTCLFSFTQATRPHLLGWSPEPAHLCRSIPGQCGLVPAEDEPYEHVTAKPPLTHPRRKYSHLVASCPTMLPATITFLVSIDCPSWHAQFSVLWVSSIHGDSMTLSWLSSRAYRSP